MTKTIRAFTVVFLAVLVSNGFCNQEKLDAERTQRLQTVFEAIQEANHVKLASCIPGLSGEEASGILKKLAEHWGETTKLVKAENVSGEKLDKGNMKIIANWGTTPTQTGRWMELKTADKGTVLRIGLLFEKDGSEARQFVAAEWNLPPPSAKE